MSSEHVGEHEAHDIEAQVNRILKGLGNPEPPLSLPEVRELLNLDLKYYSAKNTDHVQEIAHRIKVAGKQVISRPTLLWDAISKANLSALWIPDSKRILIDKTVPQLKHRWIEAHEINHSIIPWHNDFLFGDDSFTLDPKCHAIIEAEANYGAARLLFFGDRFAIEARDYELNFGNIKHLATQYGNTITSTFWRAIEDRDPDRPVFGMITGHPHYPEHPKLGIQKNGNSNNIFIRSEAFRIQFGSVKPEETYALLEKHASTNMSGPIVNTVDIIKDINDDEFEFRIESFSNSHSLLTFGILHRKRTGSVLIV